MHHVCGIHEWKAPIFPGERTWCTHAAIEEGDQPDKIPLIPGSPAHKAMVKVVLDEMFLKNIPRFLNLR